jgi:hypothetical protein
MLGQVDGIGNDQAHRKDYDEDVRASGWNWK